MDEVDKVANMIPVKTLTGKENPLRKRRGNRYRADRRVLSEIVVVIVCPEVGILELLSSEFEI